MIYLYAVAEALPQPPAEITGLQDRLVEFICDANLVAAVTRHDLGAIDSAAQNIWRHEQVIERLMQKANLLPARFATLFKNDDALRAALERHRHLLVCGLDRVRGCVEFGLRAAWRVDTPDHDEIKPPTGLSGRDYMLRRANAELRRAELTEKAAQLAETIHSPLAAIVRASTRRLMATPQLPLSAAYLLSKYDMEQFRDRIRSVAENLSDVQLLCTGPWPPYHFTPELPATEACHV